jgi:hypothetical protein
VVTGSIVADLSRAGQPFWTASVAPQVAVGGVDVRAAPWGVGQGDGPDDGRQGRPGVPRADGAEQDEVRVGRRLRLAWGVWLQVGDGVEHGAHRGRHDVVAAGDSAPRVLAAIAQSRGHDHRRAAADGGADRRGVLQLALDDTHRADEVGGQSARVTDQDDDPVSSGEGLAGDQAADSAGGPDHGHCAGA